MKSKSNKVQGLEKAKQYLQGIVDPESVLILPTGERIPVNSETLESNVSEYIEGELTHYKHQLAVDEDEVVLLPIVESG